MHTHGLRHPPGTPDRVRHFRLGFSLIEVVIVIAVVGIVSAIAIPNINRMLKRLHLRNASTSVKGMLQLARARAMANPAEWCGVYFDTTNRVSVLFFDKNKNGRYDGPVVDKLHQSSQPLNQSIRMRTFSTSADSQAVVYRGDGSTRNGGKVAVYGAIGTKTFTITRQIGLIHEQ